MAYAETKDIPRGAVVLISQTGVAATAARFQNVGDCRLRVVATAAEIAPSVASGFKGSISLDPMDTVGADKTLATLFKSVTNPAYLYATAQGSGGKVEIDHA